MLSLQGRDFYGWAGGRQTMLSSSLMGSQPPASLSHVAHLSQISESVP